MQIRKALPADLPRILEIEKACFPPAEAAAEESLKSRLAAFTDSFLVAEEPGSGIIGFINGCVSDSPVIQDAMFHDIGRHDPAGAYQCIFGLDVLPGFRRRGIAASLMESLVASARASGRRGLVLTCKDVLIPYYAGFGFVDRGVSASTHGGAIWHDMFLGF